MHKFDVSNTTKNYVEVVSISFNIGTYILDCLRFGKVLYGSLSTAISYVLFFPKYMIYLLILVYNTDLFVDI